MKLTLGKFYWRKNIFAFISAFLIAFIAGLSFAEQLEQRRYLREREQADSMAEIQAGRISHVIDNLASTNGTLRALLVEGHGNIHEFNRIMPDVIGNAPIRNIALAPGGTINTIYPYEGNEDAMGHDLLEDPDRLLEASIAMDSGKQTLSGPYELKQGGIGIVARMPIYLNDDSGRQYFWGFTCVTIDIPDGLKQADIPSLETHGYTYELWRLSPDTNERQVIMRSTIPLGKHPVEESIQLPNSTWYLDISPVESWYRRDVQYLELFLTIIFALLTGFLVKSAADLSKSRADLEATLYQQTANYKLLGQLNEDLRAFRHDSSNHMLSLSNLLDREDIAAAKDYIHSINLSLSASLRIVNTENYVFDALLAEKLYEARNRGIHTEQEIFIDRQLSIENSDWSTLFGNALDNAIEACINSGEDPLEIRVYIRQKKEMLHICITNTALCPETSGQGQLATNKSDKQNHGLGLNQIRSIVKKYHGTLETSWSNGVFTLSILLLHV